MDIERIISYQLALKLVSEEIKSGKPGNYLSQKCLLDYLETSMQSLKITCDVKQYFAKILQEESKYLKGALFPNKNGDIQLRQEKSRNPGIVKLGENVRESKTGPHVGPTHPTVYRLSGKENSFYLNNMKGKIEYTSKKDLYWASIANWPTGVVKILFSSKRTLSSYENKTVKFSLRLGLTQNFEVITVVTAVNDIWTDDVNQTENLAMFKEREDSLLKDDKGTRDTNSHKLSKKLIQENSQDLKMLMSHPSLLEGEREGQPTDSHEEIRRFLQKLKVHFGKEIDETQTISKSSDSSSTENDSNKTSGHLDEERSSTCEAATSGQTVVYSKSASSDQAVASSKSSSVTKAKPSSAPTSDKVDQFDLSGWKSASGNSIKVMQANFETIDWKEISRHQHEGGMKEKDTEGKTEDEEEEVEVMLRAKIRLPRGCQLIAVKTLEADLLVLHKQ